MNYEYYRPFGGYPPHSKCPLCGSYISDDGFCHQCIDACSCAHCSVYPFPEPLASEDITPQRWKEMRLIRINGKAAGKTQHEINIELCKYAWKVTHPHSSTSSPYLSTCDIPTAPVGGPNPHRIGGEPCPVCGTYIDYDSYYCTNCPRLYSEARYHKDFPAPFTQRIFHFNNWEDIQLIRKRGKQLGKTEQEIEQAVAQYAKEAVKEMQANASWQTTAAQHIFPISSSPASASRSISASATQPAHSSNAASSSAISSRSQSHSTTSNIASTSTESPHPQSTLSLRARYLHKRIIDHYKGGQCYICGQRYWTLPAARACCAEEKKRTPPGTRQAYVIPLSPYRFSEPCPMCGGSGKYNGFVCGMCDGRGSLRL